MKLVSNCVRDNEDDRCLTFELVGSRRVVFVLVRMPFQRCFAIRFLDLILRSGWLDACRGRLV